MNILLLGPQGSGKGTQGELVSKKYGLLYFDAGSHLREIAKTDPEIDRVINETGALLPDEVVFEIVKKYLLSLNKFDGILFDGFPRSTAQYGMLSNFLSEHQTSITHALVLEIPEDETVRRLSSRRTDPVTHEIYNLITNPPGPEVDPATLVQREDDTEPLIRKRLAAYRSVTEPLVKKLMEEGKVIEIDGTRSIDAIFSEITEKIDPLV